MTVMMNQWTPTTTRNVQYMLKGTPYRRLTATLYIKVSLGGALLDHTHSELLTSRDFKRSDEEMEAYINDRAAQIGYLLKSLDMGGDIAWPL